MDNKRSKSLLGLLLIMPMLSCTILNSFAQKKTPKEIENDLAEIYSKIFPFYYGNHDSLEFYSLVFSNKIFAYINKDPLTLNYPFQTLIDNNDCKIATSEDGLFRIYSWDTWLGGTMHDFENIFQYKSGNRVYCKAAILEEGGPAGFYSEIFTLKADSKTYYLGITNGIYSTKDVSESIKIFSIEDGRLNDTVKLIKTSSRLANEINVDFDFFKVTDRGPERPVRIIKYDKEKKIIYIPVVLEDGTATNRFILYKFNGRYFEKIPAQRGKQ